MNSANCSGVSGGWQASDGGQWWLRDTPYSEPNGDYTAYCLLGMYAFGQSETLSALTFNDGSCGYSSGPFYLCSTNDQYCLPGTYSTTGYGSCGLCPAGTYSSTIGATSCSPCPPGFYCQGGTDQQPCPAGTFSTSASAKNSSTCEQCASGTSSLAGSTSCVTPGLSCRSVHALHPSSLSGWYKINTSSATNLSVYCDMTTDGGVAYTIFPCETCSSVSQIDSIQPNGCTDVGMQMVVPRTQVTL
jgi:Tyrosine-protein kinase ephrin type A/B receptor-like